MAGYGVYWAIVEDLYNNANALQLDCAGIAYDLRVDEDMIESILNDFNLFVIKDSYFGSMGVQERIDQRNERSEKARESAFKRWDKEDDDANAMRTHSECNAIKESKVNEIKGNDIKDGNLFLTYDEIQNELKNSDQWLDDTARAQGVDRGVILKFLKAFILLQRSEQPGERSLNDFRRHFSRWLKKELAKPKEGKVTAPVIKKPVEEREMLSKEEIEYLTAKGINIKYRDEVTEQVGEHLSEFWKSELKKTIDGIK